MKAVFASLVLVGVASAHRLEARIAQSPAVCQQSFSWAGNQAGVSPCQTVANVDAQCNNGNWVIDALNASVHYSPPSGPTATFCTCSWASYNLISACTACQGFPEQIPTWDAYSVGCAGQLTTDSFFPSNITLPSTVGIPFWAQKNPTEWPGGKFDSATAQNISAQNHPDFVGGKATPKTDEPTKKKSNTGAIAGGVVGGLVVIGAAIAIALWMLRRSRKPAPGAIPLHTGTELLRPGHMRSMSDISTFKAPENYGLTNFTGGTINGGGTIINGGAPMNGGFSGLMPPTSPVMTHFTGGSTHSIPHMASTVVGASAYGTTVPSPPPVPRVPTPGGANSTRREDIVEPFTAPPTHDANMDRKNRDGSFPVAVYSDPNAPHPNTSPMRMEIERTAGSRPGVARRNPPAYDHASPGGASSSGRPNAGHIRSKSSTDTNHSMTSSRSGMPVSTSTHSPNTSISTMPPIAGQMHSVPGVREVASPIAPPQIHHGRKISAAARDVKVRPEDDAFSARDIA